MGEWGIKIRSSWTCHTCNSQWHCCPYCAIYLRIVQCRSLYTWKCSNEVHMSIMKQWIDDKLTRRILCSVQCNTWRRPVCRNSQPAKTTSDNVLQLKLTLWEIIRDREKGMQPHSTSSLSRKCFLWQSSKLWRLQPPEEPLCSKNFLVAVIIFRPVREKWPWPEPLNLARVGIYTSASFLDANLSSMMESSSSPLDRRFSKSWGSGVTGLLSSTKTRPNCSPFLVVCPVGAMVWHKVPSTIVGENFEQTEKDGKWGTFSPRVSSWPW